MLTLEQIEAAILQLSADQFHQLLEWFLELDHQRWDEQLERDIAEGKLVASTVAQKRKIISAFLGSGCLLLSSRLFLMLRR